MKGKVGRPRIPFSNISNRKGDGLTGSPSPAPAGEGNAQLAHGGAAKKRMDKKRRGAGKIKRADGGSVATPKTDGEPDDAPISIDKDAPEGKKAVKGAFDYYKKSDDHESDMDPQEKKNGGWIKGAIKHPGAEKKAANEAGMSTHAYMEKHKHDGGKSGARARLGLTLSKMAKDKK